MPKRRPYPKDVQAEVVAANREHREVELTDEQLANLGHHKRPLSKAIRSFCLDCMGGNRAEVRRCTSVGCDLFPYRMGSNPYHGRSSGFSKSAQIEPAQPERAEQPADPSNASSEGAAE
jgi:hypothetical protein